LPRARPKTERYGKEEVAALEEAVKTSAVRVPVKYQGAVTVADVLARVIPELL
jgi:hypothetical protein